MNKGQLIDVIAKETGYGVNTVEKIVSEMHEVISETLEKGDSVRIPGFGTFSSKKKDARKGRNPKTGQTLDIPAKVVAKFKPAKELETHLNS